MVCPLSSKVVISSRIFCGVVCIRVLRSFALLNGPYEKNTQVSSQRGLPITGSVGFCGIYLFSFFLGGGGITSSGFCCLADESLRVLGLGSGG